MIEGIGAAPGWLTAVPRIVRLAVPMTASRFGLLLILVTDVAMLGRVDSSALAAFAVAAMPAQFLTAICNGLLGSVTVMVARDGSAQPALRPRILAGGCILALVAGTLAGAVLMLGPFFLPVIVGEPHLAADGGPIAQAFAVGMPGLCLFMAMAAFQEARGHVVPVLWAVALGIVVNGIGNGLVLSEGDTAAQAAWNVAMVTSVARWTMCTALILQTLGGMPSKPVGLARAVGALLRLGAPMAFASMLESSAFTTIALFATRFGSDAVAAYEISSTVVRIAHLPALGLGAAATVLVGRAIGVGETRQARDTGRAGYAVVLTLMAVVALPLLTMPEATGRWFSAERGILDLLATLFPLTAAIVVADGAQAVLAGSLRGHGDVLVPAGLHILSFWLIAVPLGFWLGIRLDWSIDGCATALAVGLVAATVAFTVRLRCLRPLRAEARLPLH